MLVGTRDTPAEAAANIHQVLELVHQVLIVAVFAGRRHQAAVVELVDPLDVLEAG